MLNPIAVWLWGEVRQRQGFLLTRDQTAKAAQPFRGAALHPALRTHNPGRAPTSHRPRDHTAAAKGQQRLFPSAQIPLPLPLGSRPGVSWGTVRRCLALLQLPRVRGRVRGRSPAAPSLQAGTQLPLLQSPLNPPATSSSRTMSIPLQPPFFCPFAHFSLRFLFPGFPSPSCL